MRHQYFNRFLTSLLLSGLLGMAYAQSPALGNAATLPFTLSIEEVTQDELPGLHSFSFARYNDWWVIVGGRINGLHGFFPFTAFPDDGINAKIWLIDPETGDSYSYPVDNLTITNRDHLKATNPQYTQSGDWLYITGGYGKQFSTGNMITFPMLTAINLPDLVSKITAGQNPSSAFLQTESQLVQVCGGEMDKLDDYYYLVGGHDFSGNYTQQPSPMFTQKYSYEIRKFKIQHAAGNIGIQDYSEYHDEQNLRRRDFSLAPVIRPDGQPALCLYGGVFRPDIDLPYYNPVYISADDIFELDASYEQVFSQYTCPTVPLYDSLDHSMYTLFFGGLSVHYYDQVSGSVKYDEKVPFINDISTFQRKADGTSTEYLMPQRFDKLLGSNMLFAPVDDVPHFDNEVFKLRSMSGKTLVGYLFGGIKADIPNITTSSASNRMFKVFITPKNTVGTVSAGAVASDLLFSPNPYRTGMSVNVQGMNAATAWQLVPAHGSTTPHSGTGISALETLLSTLPTGIYFLKSNGKTAKMIKL